MNKKLLCFFTTVLLLIPTVSHSAEPQVNIKNFSELKSKYKHFHYLAWKKSADEISKGNNVFVPVVEIIGPNSKKCDSASVQAIAKIQKMYAKSKLPKKLNILYSDSVDKEWLAQKTSTMLNEFEIQKNKNVMFNPEAINSNTKEAVVWFEDSCSAKDEISITGAGTAHGYTHAIQKLQFVDSPESWGSWGKAPRWLLEGGATFSENIIALGGNANTWKNAPQFHNHDLKKYDLKFYEDFLSYNPISYSWEVTNKYPNQRVYDIGSIVCEILIAIKGPSSIIDLYYDFSKTQNFELSFKNVYGVSWSYAKPKISFAVYKFIQEN
jgi:hypothetical protein